MNKDKIIKKQKELIEFYEKKLSVGEIHSAYNFKSELAALELLPDQDLPSDEDIEEWADNLATDVTNGVTPSKDKHGHLIKATLFTGAKAMRDGWIKSNRK